MRSLEAQPGVDTPAVNIWTAPLVDSAGDVYYGTHGGEIYGHSPRGSRLFAIPTGKTVDSYPALSATGDLLIGSDNGYLYSIGRCCPGPVRLLDIEDHRQGEGGD